MTYDVLVIDELEGEIALLNNAWAGEDLRIITATSLESLRLILTGRVPANVPPGPYNFRAALVDLDLGSKSEGAAGGLIAIHELLEWMDAAHVEVPIALRAGDIDDGRSMAAVLAAELVRGPLPIWGKSFDEARGILMFLRALADDPRARPTSYGASLIQRVVVRTGERGAGSYLGEILYAGDRAEVWKRLADDGPETSHIYGGFPDRNEFWEPHLKNVVLAINYLRDAGLPLHQLDSNDLKPGDIGIEVLERASKQIDEALEALTSDAVPISTAGKRKEAVSKLKERSRAIRKWLDGDGRRPHHHNATENGEFLGAYKDVVCNETVADLMTELYKE